MKVLKTGPKRITRELPTVARLSLEFIGTMSPWAQGWT